MLTTYLARQHAVFVVALLVGGAGCGSTNVQPPEIAKPLAYDTVDVILPGCATRRPPIRHNGRCGAGEIGKSIDAENVCQLLGALKNWVASPPKAAPSVNPDDWTLVRSVCVFREAWASSADTKRQPPRSFLRLDADVPNRSQRMSVRMSEQSWTLEYFVSPR